MKNLRSVALSLISLLALIQSLQKTTAGRPTSNKMRYAKSEQTAEPQTAGQKMLLEDASAFDHTSLVDPYKINRDNRATGSLDQEDRDLLEKFYREQDPFSSKLSTSALWEETRDQEMERLGALLDINPLVSQNQQHNEAQTSKHSELDSGWTIDPEMSHQIDKLSSTNANHLVPSTSKAIASYSPTLKLLTTYNPLEKISSIRLDDSVQEGPRSRRGNRIVGATLFGRDETSGLDVSSKSPADAVRLQEELFEAPPRDGKVRVRMYFHRAMHDDVKLYGTGPWKYWGHGWGIEFGYDPRSEKKPDFYQRGYTIERAFGRDFCKDKSNCRKPDPKFFENPLKVGEYSRKTRPKTR